MSRASLWLVGAGAALLISACSSAGATLSADQQPAPTGPTPTAPVRTVPRPVSTAGSTGTPSSSRVLAANDKLSTSLAHLATASQAAHDSNTLSAPRSALRDAIGATRRDLTATRTASYHSLTRSCTAVWSEVSATRTAATSVESARNRVFAVTHEMRAKAATLKSKRAAVARDWSELARILEQGQATKKVVTSDRVNAALKDAQQMAADTLAAAARAESTATGAVTKANSMSGRAATIAAKACG